MTQPAPSERHYAEQLGAVLRRRDPEALRPFLEASARAFGDEAQVAQIRERTPEEMADLMHQIILARPDLANLHPESRAWLDLYYPRPEPPRRRQRPKATLRTASPKHEGDRPPQPSSASGEGAGTTSSSSMEGGNQHRRSPGRESH